MKGLIRRLSLCFLLVVGFAVHAADPVATQITQGDSNLASVTVSFSAQAAGTLLVLDMLGDDYSTGTPSGWTQIQDIGSAESSFHGHTAWYKIASGAETSVVYTIGSASKSTYILMGFTNIEPTSSLDVSAKQNTNSDGANYATPTSPTTAVGRKYAIGLIGFHTGGSGAYYTAIDTWTNSYAEVGQVLSAGAAPSFAIGVGGLAFDGGGTTSTQANFTPTNANSRSSIIAVFKVAAGGSGSAVPLLIQQQSMNAANDEEYWLVSNSR